MVRLLKDKPRRYCADELEIAYKNAMEKLERLKTNEKIIACYLFGSFVYDRERSEDIDICIISENLTLDEMAEIQLEFDEPVDISFMQRMPYYVAVNVFKDGVPIFVNDESKLLEKKFEVVHQQLAFDNVRDRIDSQAVKRSDEIIGEIIGYFNDLEDFKNSDLTEKRNFYAVSMILFSIINDVLLLAEVYIHQNRLSIPLSYKGMIDILAEKQVIDRDLGEKIKGLITKRNIMAHEYGEFTREDLFQLLKDIEVVKDFVYALFGKRF